MVKRPPFVVHSAMKYHRLLSYKNEELGRNDFPSGFQFGVATAAYQIEGAAFEGGRGLTIWDVFSHIQGNIEDGSTGDVACDHYHRYKEDVLLMKNLGVDVYRFSIAWSRIFPDGSGQINFEGVLFYNGLIDCLLEAGIKPYVTLYHWDLPLWLECDANVKGFLTKEIVKHFAYYAKSCFELFGDRVKNWVTFNEIRTVAVEGYGDGSKAPGRSSISISGRPKKNTGDSSTEPYIVAHNALLAHAAAVQVYRKSFQPQQEGRIGMVVDGKWFEPYSDAKEDEAAAQRCLEFEIAWFLDPLFGMDYPDSLRKGAGDRLPKFTDEELSILNGSVDFIGYNYYTAYYAKHSDTYIEPNDRWHMTDRLATTETSNCNGSLIGERLGPPDLGWIYNCPWALPKMLQWLEQRYSKEQIGKIPLYITENGTMDMERGLPPDAACNDLKRIEYLKATLQHLTSCIKVHGYNVQGYFVWSIMDNFEWNSGLGCRFGLYYVDFDKKQRRIVKKSAEWYHDFLLGHEQASSKNVKSTCCQPWLQQILQDIRTVLGRLPRALQDCVVE